MNVFTTVLEHNKDFNTLLSLINQNKNTLLATGVLESQKTQLVYAISQHTQRTAVVITGTELAAQELFEDMSFFAKRNVMLYPAKDIIFYNADVKSSDIIKKRFEVISSFLKTEKTDEPMTLIMPVEALFDKLVCRDVFKKYIISLKLGDIVSLDELTEKLVYMGYERCSLVEGPGQFAVRGGILDLYSFVMENAVRIEFWDNEIDSIRLLDSFSQRSIDKIESLDIYPVRELVYSKSELDGAIDKIKYRLNAHIKKYLSDGHKKEAGELKSSVNELIEKLNNDKNFSGVDKLIDFFYDKTSTILDYLPNDLIIYFDEPVRIEEHAETVFSEFSESIKNRILKGYMLPELSNMIYTYNDVLNFSAKYTQVLFSAMMYNIHNFSIEEAVNFNVKSLKIIKNNFDMFIDELKYLKGKGYKIIVLIGSAVKAERLNKTLTEENFSVSLLNDFNTDELISSVVYIIRGELSHGFEYPEDKFAVISDKSIFGSEKKKVRRKRKNGVAIENFSDLKVGDYVVHDNYGIGVFKGVEKISADGVSKDYIKLGYADDGNLYIAINQMDMIQKYIGGEANLPKLNKLGAQNWSKSKAKAKKAAVLLAENLVKVYAERQAAKGFVYSKDTVWQREFEETFPYEETEDQLNAVADIKADMESERVMDRLICGDVGFGKTEIAIRAAFKAVQDSKQVAFLVPTTILAQQHYSTFIQRMQNFPVAVEMLSRFRTPKQQKEIIEKLKTGAVDIVIGTHRILSKDLNFKDLGLIIVDEEQRFGVAHKDKFKQLKQNVDILTLSATPIPRTLHMSMTGIRDMSVLEEPPGDRLPIQTYVMEFAAEFVKDAIHRELARGGQVYYLYNHVSTIAETASKLQQLVPEASVAYAHGQMSERELENIMIDFMQNNVNVLVCTTIIETGLDIPNVNTIIIQDADCMGLSQLYQLRGRVGRSNRTAYAYLMYKRNKVLKEISEKRLQTIKEFTEFGSGIKIAMRDLEIRGAGNLLGAQQHGHMESVGYDMYCRLLDEAVRELQGEQIMPEFETLIDISINAYIPDSYISNGEQKLEMYKKIAHIRNQENFYDIQDELEDRYGTMSKPVDNLINIALMKAYAHELGAISITQKKNNIIISFKQENSIDLEKMTDIIKNNKNIFYNGDLVYRIDNSETDFVHRLTDIFKTCRKEDR